MYEKVFLHRFPHFSPIAKVITVRAGLIPGARYVDGYRPHLVVRENPIMRDCVSRTTPAAHSSHFRLNFYPSPRRLSPCQLQHPILSRIPPSAITHRTLISKFRQNRSPNQLSLRFECQRNVGKEVICTFELLTRIVALYLPRSYP